jgi:lipid II:glycine glycyltransferase (peptidoglycan interpeptide bridge formation enzyme)
VPERKHFSHAGAEIDLAAGVRPGYRVQLSRAHDDPAWDAFLAEMPEGHHMQTSLWCRVKALLGWRVARVCVTQSGQIVAGAQMLLRSLPFIGTIGYVPKGPLAAFDEPTSVRLVFEGFRQIVRACRVRYLLVEPLCQSIAQSMSDWGFQPNSMEVTSAATVRIDLSSDLDQLLAQMRAKTRYNLRLGLRKGVSVREGTQSDLGTFYQLLAATGQRQGFAIHPQEYFHQMWRILHAAGHIRLFIAEYAGEAVSALLAIPFGQTVSFWAGAWSGQHGQRHPNEVMHWAAIRWGKAAGYRYYDFEGIDLQSAKALATHPASSASVNTVTAFKVGFGGQVVFFPGAYDYIANPLLSLAYRAVGARIAGYPTVQNAVRGIKRR